IHYRPHGAILTSVEWDHVDIYPQFEKMIGAFQAFLKTLGKDSILLAWADSEVISELTRNPAFKLFRYGRTQGDYTAKDINTTLPPALAGPANLENALGVAGLCRQLGLSPEQIAQGLKTFQGVKKRQEVKGVVKEVTVIDDFAHHPTAVRRTIEALKEKYPGQRLITVFEPRSNTSRRNAHYQDYLKAFKGADRVLLAPPWRPEKIPPAERLDTEKLADDLMRRGVEAFAIEDHDAIVEYILRSIGPKEVVAFFSNGDFNNIHRKLLDKLERRKIVEDRKQVRSIKVKK
ncbi:MAG: UDP-N-acetylmuramate:L-alanyl-gamma-D-glutamyl-meso-diaminopimelate ligase, partial [Deltaproteobacteria bacterium]|nr:UDP-N-acetylmuramate:L-alanyl-gamma-D-glutamyl-meso-diaminopimelate ligase [Deltaproteobacteria bacterium]